MVCSDDHCTLLRKGTHSDSMNEDANLWRISDILWTLL